MGNFLLYFGNIICQIPKKKRIISIVTDKIADYLLNNNSYCVKSNVNFEIFEMFLKFWENEKDIPDIQPSNIHEYETLNQEFQILSCLLSERKKSPLFKIECLINPFFGDKSTIEKEISQQLDYYLDNYTDKMYQIPINSLYNIFNNENRNLISHSKAYRFITQKSTSSKNISIDQSLFILIKTLDGNILYDESKDSFIELISKFNEIGFLPQMNQSFISEQIERTNKIKQNELKEMILHQNYEKLRNIINNEHITFLELPDGITDIPDFAFFQCQSLKEFILSNTVNSIGNYAFYRCSSLTSIFIPSTVKSIGKGCFSHCKKLRNIKIPNSLEKINDRVFDGCSSLEELIIPKNIKSIESCVFAECVNLKKCIIENCDCSIGNWTFCGCSSLHDIKLPSNLKEIQIGTFINCSKLLKIEIPSNVSTIKFNAFQYCSSLSQVIIPSKIKTIEASTFLHCTSLKEVILPSNLICISASAFSGCTNLHNIVFPESLEIIGNNAFKSCTSLTEIKLKSNVKKIDWNAFYGCTSLQNIELPSEKVIDFGSGTFNNCPKLKEININVSKNIYIRSNTFDNNTKVNIIKIFPVTNEKEIIKKRIFTFNSCTIFSKLK